MGIRAVQVAKDRQLACDRCRGGTGDQYAPILTCIFRFNYHDLKEEKRNSIYVALEQCTQSV